MGQATHTAETLPNMRGVQREGTAAVVLSYVFLVPYLLFIVESTFLTPTLRIPAPVFGWPLVLWGLIEAGRGKHWPLPKWMIWVLVIMGFRALEHDPRNSVAQLSIMVTALLLFRLYVSTSVTRWLRICRLFLAILFFSGMVMLIGRVIDPELSIRIRKLLFVDVLYPTPLGLARRIHTFGYQVAAIGAATIAIAAIRGSGKHLLIVPPAMIIGTLTLLWGMQRSAVVSTILSFLCLVPMVRRKRILIAGTIAGLVAVSVMGYVREETTQPDVYGKHLSDTTQAERLQMQLEGMELIAKHPLGLILSGYSYKEVVATQGGLLSVSYTTPHNAYLQVILSQGVPIVLLLFYGFFLTGRAIFRIARGLHTFTVQVRLLSMAMAMALVATLVNATMHNASLFTANGPTVFCFVAVHHWADMLARGDVGDAFRAQT